MPPQTPQPEPAPAASLPPMPAAHAATPMPAVPAPAPQQTAPQGQPARPGAPMNATQQAAAQAQQLISQYGQNPYALSQALQQLKAQYLADQFHIVPNAVEQ